MKKPTQLVRDMIDHSAYGPLAAAFVLQAIQRYADAIAATKPDDYPEAAFIAPTAWIGVAKEVQATLAAHYAGKPTKGGKT